jgi:CubicO group peptidase (beta-lactamase class C family)
MTYLTRKNSCLQSIAFALLLFTGQIFQCRGQQSAIPLQTKLTKEQLAESLNKTIPPLLDSAAIPGLSLAVIADGKLIYHQTFGVIHAETKDKVNANTVFEAASLSKPVFAYICLKLVDAGLLELDKPLYQYLPYADIERDARYRKITARMVLSHTTGFPNWRNDDSLRINFEPGQKFSYSGEGYVYLQKVVEKLSGLTLNELATEQVFRPLGMANTSFVWREGYNHTMASPHNQFGEPMTKRKPDQANAASSLHTTALDYARFMTALLNGTGLKKKSLASMLTSQVEVPQDRQKPDGPVSSAVSWGLGVGLQQTKQGRSFWHWGDNYAFKCYAVAYPDQKLGVVYFTNSYNGLSIAKAVLARTIGGDHPVINFLGYENYQDTAFIFKKNAMTEGVQKALAPFLDASKKALINESTMHQFGHQLLGMRKLPQAKEVFAYNRQCHPQSPFVYEGYAFACLVNGELVEAAENYQKFLDFKPDIQEARTIYNGLLATQSQKGKTEFRLRGRGNAKLVTVAGTFNDWFPFATFLIREGDDWVCRLDIKPGDYQYKFVVDGQWILDPANQATAREKGHTNSLVKIR